MFDVCIIKAMKRGNLQGMQKKNLQQYWEEWYMVGYQIFYSLVAYRGKGPVSDRQNSTPEQFQNGTSSQNNPTHGHTL